MLDRDLAELYGVETKVLNQAVKRNKERFPESFCFILTQGEKDEVVTNCDHLSNLRFSYNLPYAFTEQGVAMLSRCVKKFNEQYEPVEVLEFDNSHDRFIVIDEKIIYHFGASLKDLGKKWFGFSKMDNRGC
jgi:hypothetical protein